MRARTIAPWLVLSLVACTGSGGDPDAEPDAAVEAEADAEPDAEVNDDG